MSVRGMPAGNVSFTLDRVPLDNPYHLGGFNSIFNPDLLAEVRFYASAPPSSAADTTGALLEVTSWDGAQRDARPDLDGAVDISASSARVVVQGPVGNDFSFAVAGRRSYLELYLEAMKALDLLDQAVVAPEYDEIGARARWARGDHRLRLTLLRASDQLGLVDSSDESAITIDGTLVMDDELYLAALDHQADLGRHELETTVAFSADRSHFERDFAGPVVRDVSRQQYFLRSDLRLDLGGGHTVAAGPWLQVRRYQASGPVEDTRGVPAEVAVPIANFDRAFVTLAEPELRPAAALYAQHDWAGPVRTRAGVRTTWVERTGEWLASPSAGISLPLPTGTIPKLTAGVYHRVVEDALMVDANLGNPDLTAEQSWQVAGGVDQGLPWLGGGLFRVEGYYHRLLDLAVAANGSCCDATPAYTNDGTGYNAGIDVLVALRADRFLVTGNGSWLQAARTIPDPYGEGTWTLTPGWVQTWTAGLSGEYQLAPAWRVAARYDFRSGRPMSTVGVASVDAVRLATVNSTTLGDFHQVDLRVEWRAASPTLRWSVYLEVLNATYAQNDFLPIANVVDGELETGMFRHLPTRPFLGARVDF
jgi:hypothetical protein